MPKLMFETPKKNKKDKNGENKLSLDEFFIENLELAIEKAEKHGQTLEELMQARRELTEEECAMEERDFWDRMQRLIGLAKKFEIEEVNFSKSVVEILDQFHPSSSPNPSPAQPFLVPTLDPRNLLITRLVAVQDSWEEIDTAVKQLPVLANIKPAVDQLKKMRRKAADAAKPGAGFVPGNGLSGEVKDMVAAQLASLPGLLESAAKDGITASGVWGLEGVDDEQAAFVSSMIKECRIALDVMYYVASV